MNVQTATISRKLWSEIKQVQTSLYFNFQLQRRQTE